MINKIQHNKIINNKFMINVKKKKKMKNLIIYI